MKLKYKYMLVFEDNEIKVTNEEPTSEDLGSVNDGVLELINLEDYTSYYKGVWLPLGVYNKPQS